MQDCVSEVIEKNCIYDMCCLQPGTSQPAVIIIGAGLAGLSAAQRLVQCGISNFKILEALDRPGGRIKTCWLGDTAIEMGAAYIDGASIANPVYTLAAQERLIKAPLPRLDAPSDMMYFTSEGRAIEPRLAEKASKIFFRAVADASLVPYCESKTAKDNLNKFMDDAVLEAIRKLPEIERYDVARVIYGLKSTLGDKLNSPISAACGHPHSLPGGRVQIPLGMGSLLAPLIRDMPDCSMVFCKPVYCIRWGTASGCGPRVVVRACDGEEFPADYVIVTVPLGVLKNKADSLFCPALPACKMDAIQKLGFGNVSKVFLQFDAPFWVGDRTEFRLAWSPQELAERTDWLKGVTSFASVPGSNKVLEVTISGPEAKFMEQQENETVARDLTELLRTFLGDSTIPYPKELAVTDWSSNSNFYGSYTYIGPESNVGHIWNMADPLPGQCEEMAPIILFAGEHTSVKFHSTLQGARESGIREADRIIKLTKQLNGPPVKQICIPCKTVCTGRLI
ncbi:Flavin containing amine oxidoreductase [Nesidiocoris tenuis]|nr:Flavin containing amine oxidoreductase [Nesidiocoris tenuis]